VTTNTIHYYIVRLIQTTNAHETEWEFEKEQLTVELLINNFMNKQITLYLKEHDRPHKHIQNQM